MSASLILQTLGWVPVAWLVTTHLLVERGRLARDGVALRLAGCAAAAVVITAAALANMWPVAALGLLWLRTEVFAHRHPIHEYRAHREQVRHERVERERTRHELDELDDEEQSVLIPKDQAEQEALERELAEQEAAERQLAELDLAERRLAGLGSTGKRSADAETGPAGPGTGDPSPAAFLNRAMKADQLSRPDPGGTAVAAKPATLPRPRRNPRPTTARAASSHGPAHPDDVHPSPGPGRSSGGSGRGSGHSASHPTSHGPARKTGSRTLDAIFKIEVMVMVILVLVGIGVWAQHQKYDFKQKADASLCRFMGGC